MTGPTTICDLRGMFGPARDQGPRPTCVAFAASDAHAALLSGWQPLSCEYAYYQAQRRAGRPSTRGSTLLSMIEALRDDGQPEEPAWPYSATPPDPTAWTPPAAGAPLHGRDGATSPTALADVVAALDARRPVILLLMLSPSFFRPGPDGVVRPGLFEKPEPARRHAVVACGHGIVDGEPALLVRNSWGDGWGIGGHAWLTAHFLAPRLFAAAILKEETHVPARSIAA